MSVDQEAEEDNDEARERRQAEIDFVEAAYDPQEAWFERSRTAEERICRRLLLSDSDDNGMDDGKGVRVRLQMAMARGYPVDASLQVSAVVDNQATTMASTNSKDLLKSAQNALPDLVRTCRELATECVGEEAVLQILTRADEWLQDDWPKLRATTQQGSDSRARADATKNGDATRSNLLGRRLIYSHHIISKIKRGDIKKLANQYNLTGYMKIGWPGILIIEGSEEDCNSFYDDIRPWSWKYLVVRGEQQEKVLKGQTVDSLRRFDSFLELDSMKIVAEDCRNKGLEALFKTSMKVYGDAGESDESMGGRDTTDVSWHGALVRVDHMNSAKAYRKWLRKTGQEMDALLFIKECYPNDDYSKRPTILVGIVGAPSSISGFLKKWRTNRVDVDSKGKPCLERMMKILAQGEIHNNDAEDAIDWDQAMSESTLKVSMQSVMELADAVGGSVWRGITESVVGGP